MPRVVSARRAPGSCAFCNQSVTKQGIARHLATCAAYQTALHRADRSNREPVSIFQLLVQNAYGGEYWLALELRGTATLKDLDSYLRAIWLECCGHMSQFSIGGWRGDEIPESRRAAAVLHQGLELTHIYDFGTESETRIRVVGEREGPPLTAKPLTLLARNVAPSAACIECGVPASFLCTECVIEHERWGTLCDAHVTTHPHDQYGDPIRLVNSPRIGLCGYTGPAEAPY